MPIAALVLFAVALAVGVAVAVTGRRDLVCDRQLGYAVPANVAADPQLRERANRLVERNGYAASAMAAVAMIPAADVAVGDGELPTWGLALLALWGLAYTVVLSYPFHAISSWGN